MIAVEGLPARSLPNNLEVGPKVLLGQSKGSPRGIAKHLALADVRDVPTIVPEPHDRLPLSSQCRPTGSGVRVLPDAEELMPTVRKRHASELPAPREIYCVAAPAQRDMRLPFDQDLAPDGDERLP